MKKLNNVLNVSAIINNNGRPVANQYVITTDDATYFKSYDTLIAGYIDGQLVLDKDYWDYSRTTSRHRNNFTGLSTLDTKRKIKNGSIKLVSLNSDNHYVYHYGMGWLWKIIIINLIRMAS